MDNCNTTKLKIEEYFMGFFKNAAKYYLLVNFKHRECPYIFIEFKIKVIYILFSRSSNSYLIFNKLNYKMQRTLESCSAHVQMIQKFQTVFPNLNILNIEPSDSILEALNNMIKKIPRPHFQDTQKTICSMKNYVDGQELRIQMNMIQIEQTEPLPIHTFIKKCSVETREADQEWDERSNHNAHDWGWESQGLAYHESLQHQFSSYLD